MMPQGSDSMHPGRAVSDGRAARDAVYLDNLKPNKRRYPLAMSHPTSKKPRPPERDYSHRGLLDKLGVKPGQRVAILGIADAGFLQQFAARVGELSNGRPLAGSDLIFFDAENKKDLVRLRPLAAAIRKDGAIWVVYPRGQANAIREMDVIAAGKAAGLVDNKVCRFSDTHTALRFVIPLANR